MGTQSTPTSASHWPAAGAVLVLAAGDTLLIMISVAVAAGLRLRTTPWEVLLRDLGWGKVLIIAGVVQVCLLCAGLYDSARFSNRRQLFTRALNAFASASLILAFLYFWFPTFILGRGVYMIAAVLAITLLVGVRVAMSRAESHQ